MGLPIHPEPDGTRDSRTVVGCGEIEGLGLRICRVLPDAQLQLVERGQAPRGANFCLLTRTPEADIARACRARKRLAARLSRGMRRLSAKWDKYRHTFHRV